QIPLGGEYFREPADFVRRNRAALVIRVAGEEGTGLLLTFFRLEGARAIDETPARPHKPGRCIEEAPLQRRELGDVRLLLRPGRVRVAPERPGRRARGIDEHGVEYLSGEPSRVHGAGLSQEAKPRQVLLQAPEPSGRPVDRHDLRAALRELGG